MTIPEIVVALDEGEEGGPPRGAGATDHAGIQAWADWLRTATPRERLEAMREGRL